MSTLRRTAADVRRTTTTLRRTTADVRRTTSDLRRTTVEVARKHSRMSLVAAAAVAAGVLSAAGFAAGAAPWTPAVGNIAQSAPGVSLSTAGQHGSSSLFQEVLSGSARTGSNNLDVVGAAAIAGKTGANGTVAAHAATAAAAKAAAQHKPAAHAASPAAKHQAGAARQAPKHQAAKHQTAKPKPQAAPQPYTIYDSVSPGTIPAGHAAAVYANGRYAASSRQVAGYHSVLWIDTNGSDPSANVLDVEPGDATPAGAAQWVKQRLSAHSHSVAIVYTMMSDWQQVKADVGDLPGWMQSQVRYWIADPTGVPHVVPGSSATQWYWGNSYDITTANPNFDN
jgi:hypothetical protein